MRVLVGVPALPGRPAVEAHGSVWSRSVVLAATLVASVATAAPSAEDASVVARPSADEMALESVLGTVIGVERAPAPGGAPHDAVRLVVATATETLTVALGPDWYVDAQGWAPAAGELVEITGRHVNDDRGVVFEAATLRAGDRQLVLRSADGVPSWAGRGEGHGRGRARRHQAGHVRLAVRLHRGAESPSLVGVVRDTSGRPVPGATVWTEPAALTVATDDNGSYTIATLHPGRYRLMAELPSFGRVCSEPIVVETGLEWSADFVLVAEVSEEVVVTGTRTERLLAETPVRTEIVGRQFLDTAPTRTLADAVEFTPGIRVENNCQNCNFQQVRMLGLDGAYTQILVDGLPTMSSLAMVYGIEQIPAQMIDRIEVIKGGGSSLYGSGAVGGIINIIPHEPSGIGGRVESRTELVSGQASEMLSGGGDWVASDRQTNLTAFGQSDWVSPVDVDGDGFTELSQRALKAFGSRLGRYLFDRRAKLTVDLSRITEDRRGGNRLDLPPHEADLTEAAWMTRHTGAVSWLHFLNPRLDYRLAVSVNDMSRDSYYGAGRDPNAYGESAGTTLIVDGQVNHRLGMHAVSWGGQFIADSLADRQPAYDRDFRGRYDNAGFYIQDDWSLGSWELVSGLRVDGHSALSGPVVSPRFALRWSPRSSLRVRASVGTGFRAPQVFDEDLHITQVGGQGQIIRLDPALREERSTSWTLGGEWAPEVGGGRGLVEVNAFSTRLRDLFHNVEADDPTTPEAEFLKTNLGGARVYGVEANLGWGVGKAFVVQGGVVAQRSRFDVPEPDFGSRDFLRTPHCYGTLVVTSRTAKVGDCFLGLRYTGSMKAPHYAGFIQEDRLETTRSFWTLDASLSRPVLRRGRRRLVVVLAGKNLTNAYQDDFDQGPDRDAGYVYGPRSPRAVSLAARVEF